MQSFDDRRARALVGRHAAVVNIMQYFDFDHLPAGPLRTTSSHCAEFALLMVNSLPDNTMLTHGLDDLLSAKDCFVRAALHAHE
jgi:hypothetical protein